MKYGNFVGQGWLRFQDDEIKAITDHLSEQLKAKFGENFFEAPKSHQDGEDGEVILLVIDFKLKNPIVSGRNVFGARLSNVTKVSFSITKDKAGWLEITDPKNPYAFPKERDYKNCPPFSYGCSLSVDGQERAYKCRTFRSIQNWSPFTYGTEAADLTYENQDLYALKNTLQLM